RPPYPVAHHRGRGFGHARDHAEGALGDRHHGAPGELLLAWEDLQAHRVREGDDRRYGRELRVWDGSRGRRWACWNRERCDLSGHGVADQHLLDRPGLYRMSDTWCDGNHQDVGSVAARGRYLRLDLAAIHVPGVGSCGHHLGHDALDDIGE